MNFVVTLMEKRINSLERSEKKLLELMDLIEAERASVDNVGPDITTADGQYISVSFLEALEEILEPDQIT